MNSSNSQDSKTKQEALAELAKRELSRRHFRHFCMYVDEDYLENWHTKLLCEALEKVESGDIRFLIIEAPPRHGKSRHVSQRFPAWVVGKEKDTDVIVASYSGDLATDHGRETRNLIETQKYQNVFKTHLAEDSSAKGKWNTNGRGSYNAAGVGGSITGKGADFFIIDDYLKDRKEADSQVIREDRWKWFRSVARTRLSPQGAMVVMATRWHQDDLIGRITEGEDKEPWVDYFDYLNGARAKWVRLTLPAIAERDEPYRKSGEPLWKERYSLLELSDIKSSLGPYEWGALYQARPVDDANRKFKKEWFHYRTWAEVEKQRTRKFATIDPNLKKSDESDYCGVSRVYVNERGEWHVRSNRYRVDASEVINLIFLLHQEGFEKIGVEEGAFSYVVEPFLKEEMRKRGKFPNVVPLKHGGRMKETRIEGLVPWYNNKQVWHIVGECSELEEELLVFPRGTHDDCADSLAYAISIVEKPMPLARAFTPSNRKRTNIAL